MEVNRDIKVVKWAELKRFSDSRYSMCPECKTGTLALARDKDMRTSRIDHCVNCGQYFEYEDIATIRDGDWGEYTRRPQHVDPAEVEALFEKLTENPEDRDH